VDVGHFFGACYIAERFGDESRIAVRFFERSFELGRHFFRGPQMLGDVVSQCLGFGHTRNVARWLHLIQT
jgi:hypothetical protein